MIRILSFPLPKRETVTHTAFALTAFGPLVIYLGKISEHRSHLREAQRQVAELDSLRSVIEARINRIGERQ